MMKRFTMLCGLLNVIITVNAQTPNWAENVAPILYNNCTSCHHSGGLGPFSLLDYQDAVNYAGSIKSDVTTRKMPPWPPDYNYKTLAHQRVLSDADIKTIQDWVNGGKPQGDLSKAPTKPTYNGNSVLSNPDLTIEIPKYTLQDNQDEYRCFPVKSKLTQDMYITDMEVLPGNNQVVHHVLVFRDLSNTPFSLDAADTIPGYLNFGGTGSSSSELIGAWVPGQGLMTYPKGLGLKLPAGSNIILQIHYPGGFKGDQDQTSVKFKLTAAGNVRDLTISPLLNHGAGLINGPLYIPANQTKAFKAKYIVGADGSVLGVGPHMHLIGKSIKVYGVLPTKDTLKLIKISDWDFHWQGFYQFKNVMKIPKGTTLYAEAFYDNTTNNPDNPNNPPKDVSVGEATTDEMMLVYFTFMLYQKGDENIVIDSTNSNTGIDGYMVESSNDRYMISPNPVQQDIQVFPKNLSNGRYTVEVYDISGKCVYVGQQNIIGNNSFSVSAATFRDGNYLMKLSNESQVFLQKFTVQR